jgi:hypothetical protein
MLLWVGDCLGNVQRNRYRSSATIIAECELEINRLCCFAASATYRLEPPLKLQARDEPI